MNADVSLVEQSDSSACPARSLQNVPVRPPIAQSTPSFFCTFLRISQKISISQRLRAGCSLDMEGIGSKSQEKEGSWFCVEVAEGEPIGRLRFVLSSCLRLRLTSRWSVPQERYRQGPFLVDEDRIGGSAIVVVDLVSDSIWCEGVGVGVGARGGSNWAAGDSLRRALGWERRANLRTTNKACSHAHTQAQATQSLHRGPPTPIPTAFQRVMGPEPGL